MSERREWRCGIDLFTGCLSSDSEAPGSIHVREVLPGDPVDVTEPEFRVFMEQQQKLEAENVRLRKALADGVIALRSALENCDGLFS